MKSDKLKSKLDRMLILQDQVNATILDLDNDEMSITEKCNLMSVLVSLISEISKLAGDYAPIKFDVTLKKE